jgi:hypothetical protein
VRNERILLLKITTVYLSNEKEEWVLLNTIYFAKKDTPLNGCLILCRDAESDCGHCDFQSHALPTELSRPASILNAGVILTRYPLIVKLWVSSTHNDENQYQKMVGKEASIKKSCN